jgi:hypothetical protein
MSVTSSSGNTYYPTTADELVTCLRNIRDAGNTVTTMTIKGHGGGKEKNSKLSMGGGGMLVGSEETILTVVPHANGSTAVYLGERDITSLLNGVCNNNSMINFRACCTYDLAQDVARSLHLPQSCVTGTWGYGVGIPGTTFVLGFNW